MAAAQGPKDRPRGSSIADCTGCEVTKGMERWGKATYAKLVLKRADLLGVSRHSYRCGIWVAFFSRCQRDRCWQGGTSSYCFEHEAVRDRFVWALRNISAGREWHEDAVRPKASIALLWRPEQNTSEQT